ncbi:MotB family protein [Methylobacterium sp. E-066]|uniref:MotB family protein n=1 Tax=Methylobacterium sp. E-066 TaxID=2836584 RepID=UPI001FB888A0|nr:MotB family protein [Methylobacterium sp. E-066]MCJ2140913.1 MotB family protein [Methylobacterium sp. E-066]
MADEPHEIIIVRRAEEEGDHHGGAWKIALADFMTAMMALFLVLWLTKATNEETKTSIANYFNPISLSDALPSKKGLSDPQPNAADPRAGDKANLPESGANQPDKAGALPPGSVARERELFQDPYAVLANLATEPDPDKPQSATIGDVGEAGRRGGDIARDPFDPLYWQVVTVSPAKTDRSAPTGITPPPARTQPDARGAGRTAATAPESAGARDAAKDAKDTKDATKDAKAPVSGPEAGQAQSQTQAAAQTPARAGPQTAAQADQAALKAEIASIFPPSAPGASSGPHVEVQGTPEGLLINVTDDLNFSMFAVGSAEPRPEMVRAMERLAKVLSGRPGKIVVRGHTDSRPFRSEVYDNWRLSTARAHIASYMLTRAGIDEARIARIEGAADRMPRNTADPKAPENRRIEILLQGASG